MAVCEEMLHCFDGASQVVRGHAVRIEMPGRSIEEDEGGARSLLDVEIGVVVARRHDDDPVDAPVAKRADQLALAARVLVAASGEDEHVPGTSRILDRAMERGGEGVGYVLQDEPDRLGLAAEPPEHRRVRVTPIMELLDRTPDLLLERRADARLAVDDA